MIDGALPNMGPLEHALANGHQLLKLNPEAAAEQAREILSKNEHNGDALRLLAKALRQLGRNKEAEKVEVEAIQSAAHNPVLVRAGQAILADRLNEAEHLVRPYLQQRPEDAAALRLLAEIATRVGNHKESERLLRKALELAPAFAAARLKLATVLYLQNKPSESLAALDELIALDPEYDLARSSKAAALARIGDYNEAISIYRLLLERSPEHSAIWISYGHILNTVGRFEESVAAFRRATALNPQNGVAWWSLANLKTASFDEADISSMLSAVRDPGVSENDRLHLNFALGKALEDKGEFAQSFNHYAAGNSIRHEQIGDDRRDTHELVRKSEQVFTKGYFEERAGHGALSHDPIFVIGLPRAGSTLIEQILSSHSKIEGTSELPHMALLRQQLSTNEPKAYPESIATLTTEKLYELGAMYLSNARLHRKTGKAYFIDKLPNNWENIGLILSIFPNAKIIDARRHPMACCFSNFKQHFARGQDFTYSLDSLGRYYTDYVRLLRHFDHVLPGRIHRVIHELLVQDPETEIRKILSYLELPFEQSCLRFHENDRAVRTPSAEQVRRPINREGVDRWRSFEPWLSELKDALGPVLDAYPDVPEEFEKA